MIIRDKKTGEYLTVRKTWRGGLSVCERAEQLACDSDVPGLASTTKDVFGRLCRENGIDPEAVELTNEKVY